MFLEKHWLTLLLIAILICLSANARAEVVTNKWIENSPFMVEEFSMGPGRTDMRRYYDSENGTVCYWPMNASYPVMTCQPANRAMINKYDKWRSNVEARKALETTLEK
jgi:hypothetical protein